jgi:anti-sigma factor RsiW
MSWPTRPDRRARAARAERVVAYLLDELDPAQRRAFEGELTFNAHLREELAALRRVVDRLRFEAERR